MVDPTDPYAREAQTFPRLSEEMAARLRAYGAEERVAAGTLLFQRGQRSVDFFFVLEGKVEVYDRDHDGLPNVFVVLGERQFSGELDLFNDRENLVSGRASVDSRVVRVTRADFRRLVSAEPDIGEIVLRALILRRVGLIRHAQGGVVLVGPGHGGDTLRLQRFLTRNNYPHRVLDTELEAGAGPFLECFYITPDELPVVILPGNRVLRNPATPESRGCARADRDHRPRASSRRGRDRRRPGRAGDCRLRGLGGPGHDRGRGHGAGRAGRDQLEDRELSGLPDRHLRPGAGRAGAGPGAEVRCPARDLARGRRARLRPRIRTGCAWRATARSWPGGGDRHRRALPQARRRELRPVRGAGHPLCGDGHGGAALRRRGGRRGRRRQLGRAGRHVPVAHGSTRAHPGARERPRRHHVGLPGAAHPVLATDHPAPAHRDHRPGGRHGPARGDLDRPRVPAPTRPGASATCS